MNVELLKELIRLKDERIKDKERIIKAIEDNISSNLEIIKEKDQIIEQLLKQNIELKIIKKFKLKSGKFSKSKNFSFYFIIISFNKKYI
jgi:hypothetical protein